MTSEFVSLIWRLNVGITGAVLLILALRPLARRWLGVRPVYALWALTPAAMVAMLAPPRMLWIAGLSASATPPAPGAAMDWAATLSPGVGRLLATAWAIGAVLSISWLIRRQAEFHAAAARGLAGPAVVGVLRPKICRPDDFAALFTPAEQSLILLHEETHIRRRDPLVNAALAVLGCALWFNPFVHLLVRYLRLDQEAACDADVLAARPTDRRVYAEALLKTQLVVRSLPLGCYWPMSARHPLARRVEFLGLASPRWTAGGRGQAAAVILVLVAAGAIWGARPPQVLRMEPDLPPAGAGQRLARGSPAAMRLDRFYAATGASTVTQGSTVSMRAILTTETGRRVATDLTAFGSQMRYRIEGQDPGENPGLLLASVAQHGDRVRVTVGLSRPEGAPELGTIELAAGRSGAVQLANGKIVTVSLQVRTASPAESAEARRTGRRPFVSVEKARVL